ncbi:hypothetical protein PACTADRAFT_1444 [Pachysolen tannophilus NRRL Y-2460]|uniref:Uncharacterized protein n=1 Tax=Pachysolen tannophilus NRRL Y-2460 TaxID=669874 RepID=A0A1E4TYV5_PACTA|nr:hypothetical protein PACTADRAFT_1444 [Pachysolen tannophilus NRRL Y-2460]
MPAELSDVVVSNSFDNVSNIDNTDFGDFYPETVTVNFMDNQSVAVIHEQRFTPQLDFEDLNNIASIEQCFSNQALSYRSILIDSLRTFNQRFPPHRTILETFPKLQFIIALGHKKYKRFLDFKKNSNEFGNKKTFIELNDDIYSLEEDFIETQLKSLDKIENINQNIFNDYIERQILDKLKSDNNNGNIDLGLYEIHNHLIDGNNEKNQDSSIITEYISMSELSNIDTLEDQIHSNFLLREQNDNENFNYLSESDLNLPQEDESLEYSCDTEFNYDQEIYEQPQTEYEFSNRSAEIRNQILSSELAELDAEQLREYLTRVDEYRILVTSEN